MQRFYKTMLPLFIFIIYLKGLLRKPEQRRRLFYITAPIQTEAWGSFRVKISHRFQHYLAFLPSSVAWKPRPSAQDGLVRAQAQHQFIAAW